MENTTRNNLALWRTQKTQKLSSFSVLYCSNGLMTSTKILPSKQYQCLVQMPNHPDSLLAVQEIKPITRHSATVTSFTLLNIKFDFEVMD